MTCRRVLISKLAKKICNKQPGSEFKRPVCVETSLWQHLTKMKVFAFVLLVLCAVLAIEASPAKKKIEQPKCALICTADYTPVCAGVPNDKSVKPKLFGNECVLDKYNCENKSNLVKISEDQCKNAGGVRLS